MLNTMVYMMDERGERYFFTENEPRWNWQTNEEGLGETAWLTLPAAPQQAAAFCFSCFNDTGWGFRAFFTDWISGGGSEPYYGSYYLPLSLPE